MGKLNDAYQARKKSTTWKNFAKANPGEAQRMDAYVAQLDAGQFGTPLPAMVSIFGQGDVGMLNSLAKQIVSTPPPDSGGGTPPPSGGQVADPGSTGGRVRTIEGQYLPINIYQAPDIVEDIIIKGSNDNAVLVQPGGKGSVLRRIHAEPCCNLPWTETYGRHGAYLKAENIVLEDFFAKTPGGPQTKNGISARMAGLQCRRFAVWGFPLAVAFFDDGTTVGTMLFEDGTGDFGSSGGACWIDGGKQEFLFRRCSFSGPSNFFLAASSGYSGKVTIDTCQLNGKPVTTAQVNGMPSARLTVK
jgi:hypothetical protein